LSNKLSKSCQKIIKKVVGKLSKSCQKNVKKLSKSWQKVSKLLICPSPDIWLKILKRSEEEEEEKEEEDL
jgi:hypothetical protein